MIWNIRGHVTKDKIAWRYSKTAFCTRQTIREWVTRGEENGGKKEEEREGEREREGRKGKRKREEREIVG